MSLRHRAGKLGVGGIRVRLIMNSTPKGGVGTTSCLNPISWRSHRVEPMYVIVVVVVVVECYCFLINIIVGTPEPWPLALPRAPCRI